MHSLLHLARHGRAEGTHPEAALLPSGEVQVRTLADQLARGGARPTLALVSPYRRARATMDLLLARLAPDLAAATVPELEPDTAPEEALGSLRAHGLGTHEGLVLVVSHLPLVERLVWVLARTEVHFTPGTLAELALDRGARAAQLWRVHDPRTEPED
jgi:phosphohistidine phosphatase SixA